MPKSRKQRQMMLQRLLLLKVVQLPQVHLLPLALLPLQPLVLLLLEPLLLVLLHPLLSQHLLLLQPSDVSVKRQNKKINDVIEFQQADD